SPTWDSYLQTYLKENRSYMDEILREIADRGPLAAGQLSNGGKSRPGVMWGWSRGKHAVETLFSMGELAATRRPSFERVYDLPERVIPTDILDAAVPDPEDAERELVRVAVRALGIATLRDICDYFRTKFPDTQRRAE